MNTGIEKVKRFVPTGEEAYYTLASVIGKEIVNSRKETWITLPLSNFGSNPLDALARISVIIREEFVPVNYAIKGDRVGFIAFESVTKRRRVKASRKTHKSRKGRKRGKAWGKREINKLHRLVEKYRAGKLDVKKLVKSFPGRTRAALFLKYYQTKNSKPKAVRKTTKSTKTEKPTETKTAVPKVQEPKSELPKVQESPKETVAS